MDRTFRYKITVLACTLLAILGTTFLYCLWTKQAVLALFFVFFHLYFLERCMNTSYTITEDGFLIFKYGRFKSSQKIPITSITEIVPMRILPVGKYCLYRYLLVTCGQKHYAVMTANEDAFLRCIYKKQSTNKLK